MHAKPSDTWSLTFLIPRKCVYLKIPEDTFDRLLAQSILFFTVIGKPDLIREVEVLFEYGNSKRLFHGLWTQTVLF